MNSFLQDAIKAAGNEYAAIVDDGVVPCSSSPGLRVPRPRDASDDGLAVILDDCASVEYVCSHAGC